MKTSFATRLWMVEMLAVFLSTSQRALHAQATNDWGVGSTNLNQLAKFWQAVERTNGPVTVLAFGDSVSDMYQSFQQFLFTRLQSKLGDAGGAFMDRYHRFSAILDGGSFWADPKTNAAPLWWTDYIQLPPGGSAYWADVWNYNGPIPCDQVGVFWVAHPGGGVFNLSVSTNAGPWSLPLRVLDGYSAIPVGRYTNLPLVAGSYRVRVDGVSGNNFVLSGQYLTRSSTGIATAYLAKNGAALDEVFAVSTNVIYPILSALDPQLVIWHMKEISDLGPTVLTLSNRLCDLEDLWKKCVRNGDVIYLGTPYDGRDVANPLWTPTQNRVVKEAAVRDGRGYLDCMTPCVSFAWMVNQGFLVDSIHPNNACYAWLVNQTWPELGFFALRVDRLLTMQAAGGQVRASWLAVTNITYQLQSSADLANWSRLQTVPGDGKIHIHTNSLSGANSFLRLELQAN